MTDDIPKLRACIDAIDDKLIALLDERCGYVKKVGAIKKATQKPGDSFVRAGREADMVRRMVACARKTAFPPAAAGQMWRMIISASLTLESDLTVTACSPAGQPDVYWLAREYFGGMVSVATEPTAKRVIGDVLGGKAQIGAVPMPDDSPEGSWWKDLPEGVRIFACVPFVLLKKMSPKALLVARVQPEATGEDLSFLKLTVNSDVSQSRLNAALEKHKLAARWVAADSTNGERSYLIEVKGFLRAEDEAVARVKTELGASVLAIRVLGAYAIPLSL